MAFDLQAHRGGLGLVAENTMAAFRNAAAIGVTTLECDVHISADGVAMVTHDRLLGHRNLQDTRPVDKDDPEFPYLGKFVARLTSQQLATLDCGTVTNPKHPGQRAVPGAQMPRFVEVLDLARTYDLGVNVETKFDVVHPTETAPRERFIEIVGRDIRRAEMLDKVSVQSFDWKLLATIADLEPRIRRYVLASERTLERGRPGASAWLDGVDIDDFADLVDAVADRGVHGLSPDHTAVDAALIERAHAAGLVVVPYTVDEPARMAELIALGIDGFITNYPDRARAELRRAGLPVPHSAQD